MPVIIVDEPETPEQTTEPTPEPSPSSSEVEQIAETVAETVAETIIQDNQTQLLQELLQTNRTILEKVENLEALQVVEVLQEAEAETEPEVIEVEPEPETQPEPEQVESEEDLQKPKRSFLKTLFMGTNRR